MLADTPPIFVPDKYDDHGKWMDGWESRRRRDGGYDWCVMELGVDGLIHGAEIDTSHFTGNYPPAASIEACAADANINDPSAWTEILPKTTLKGDQRQFMEIRERGPWHHIRLNIFPDGGVARLRLYGEAAPSWSENADDAQIELSALKNGGRIIAYNDAHYGDLWALLSEGRGKTMGDGWETRRRREPGNDWIVIALGARGIVDRIEIDTAHFKGNFPDGASIEAADFGSVAGDIEIDNTDAWKEIMPRQKLNADAIHDFGGADVQAPSPVTHIRLNIYPDGGVSRLRLFGRRAP